MRSILLLLLVAASALPVTARAQDYTVVFEGRPLRKLEASFESAVPTTLGSDDAFTYSVRIVQRQNKYYWASRDMRQLARHEAGAYITFSALDGTGYIRIGVPMLLDLRDVLPENQRKREIGYVEHLLTQFSSITYYGNRVGAR